MGEERLSKEYPIRCHEDTKGVAPTDTEPERRGTAASARDRSVYTVTMATSGGQHPSQHPSLVSSEPLLSRLPPSPGINSSDEGPPF